MDPQLQSKLLELEGKINMIYTSVKRIQLYFLITAIITVAAIVLPLIGLMFAIPHLLNGISTQLETVNATGF
jgi:hypothetical protein